MDLLKKVSALGGHDSEVVHTPYPSWNVEMSRGPTPQAFIPLLLFVAWTQLSWLPKSALAFSPKFSSGKKNTWVTIIIS